MTRLIALKYDNATGTFSPRDAVSVSLAKYGHPDCAPYHSPLFEALRAAGLVYNQTLFAACYDWRTTPDTDVIPNSNFMEDTRAMIERAYYESGGTKVFLLGHSNGPIMAQYFLVHVDAGWRETYIGNYYFVALIVVQQG
jgi:lecithin-cholesterol acyltransferase